MKPGQRPARRILYVEGNFDGTLGGSYFSLLFLVAGLDRDRFDPLVVFTRDSAILPRFHERRIATMLCPLPQPARWQGPVGRLLARAINFTNGIMWRPARLAMLLRRENISLVHLNNSIRRNHPWMIAARLAGVPCITHERGINDTFDRSDRELGRRLKAVVCISRAVADNFATRGLGDLPLVTIYNGLDPDEMRVTRQPHEIRAELGVSPSARLIGIVGNLKAWKGHELVIRAVALLRDRFPDLACLLIGGSPDAETSYRRELDALIAQHDLGKRILVTGFRSDVANYVNALEVQVHASLSPEPFGRVLLEAMALRKPLVASDAGGVPEIVVDGETGLLFEPRNAAALADCLGRLLSDQDRSRTLGEAGRRRLESNFSIANNVAQTQALYARVLDRPPVRHPE